MQNLHRSVEIWKKKLGKGEHIKLPLQSSDLEPWIKAGDTLEFAEARLFDLHKGDLVLLYSQGSVRLRLLCKRFVTEKGELFRLRTAKADDKGSDFGFEDIVGTAEAIWSGSACLWKRGEGLWRSRWRRFWLQRRLKKNNRVK
ncbi:MAG: hypothetical protein Q4F00_06460 [bacterium]|nr:hypothetical protein [bacterium]